MRGTKKLVIALFLIAIFLLAGCLQTSPEGRSEEKEELKDALGVANRSKETNEFMEKAIEVRELMEDSFSKIESNFYNYDSKYDWNNLMNSLTYTESMIREMKKYEDNIRDELSFLEDIAIEFKNSKKRANLSQLSEEEKLILNDVEEKIERYEKNKELLNSCLDSMETYREFIDIERLLITKSEDISLKMDTINTEVEGAYYDRALDGLVEVKQILRELKGLESRENDLGIVNLDETMESWDLYQQYLDEFGEYIEYLKQEDYEAADYQYFVFFQKYADYLEVVEKKNTYVFYNQVANWYDKNIGVCVDLFSS